MTQQAHFAPVFPSDPSYTDNTDNKKEDAYYLATSMDKVFAPTKRM